MTLAELINEVYTITKRPDLVALTMSSVRAATLKVHTADFFYKDLVERPVVFDNTCHSIEFNVKALFPLYRNPKYLRKVDADGCTPGCFLERVAPQNVLDSYHLPKTDVYYQAGVTLNIYSSTVLTNAVFGFYAYPDTTELTFSSWIADEFPWAIIYEAAAKILKSVGYDQQATGIRQLALEALQEVIAANLVEVGE